ncbi:hypothetical protein BROWWM01_80620 [Bradyrhizobium ottawaense]
MATGPEPIPECPHCQKPMPLCICDSVTPIENRLGLLILQHPQEQDRALGTARLLAKHFPKATLRVGLSWPSLSKALGRPIENASHWAMLYLGSARAADLDAEGEIVALNARAKSRRTSAPSRESSKACCCSTAPGVRRRRCGGAIPGC